jgi:hypothetical protein
MNGVFRCGSDNRQKLSHADQGVIVILGDRCQGGCWRWVLQRVQNVLDALHNEVVGRRMRHGLVVGSQDNVSQT